MHSEETRFIAVGQDLPNFALQSVRKSDQTTFPKISKEDCKGKWTVIFTWPFDFTFVCPTEVMEFNKLYDEFDKLNCNLFGLSIDSPYVHTKWIKELGDNIKFPFLSDVKREFAHQMGILDKNSGGTYRATYIVDPETTIRSISINDLAVGRNPSETLRLVQAFQTGKLCGCSWKPGQATLN